MHEIFEHGSEDTKSRLEIIAGALLSVKGIQKCLEKIRGQTVMLIGSLYAIVTGPATVSEMNDT